MDLSIIAGAGYALSTAREIAKTAIGIRDFNQLAVVVSQLNDQILKAQDSLFFHQTQLMAMNEELMNTKEALRLAQQVIEERTRYELFPLAQGVFVYRSKLTDGQGSSQVAHYLCQPCFDTGSKGVLVQRNFVTSVKHVCPLCNVEYVERTIPVRPLPRQHNPYT